LTERPFLRDTVRFALRFFTTVRLRDFTFFDEERLRLGLRVLAARFAGFRAVERFFDGLRLLVRDFFAGAFGFRRLLVVLRFVGFRAVERFLDGLRLLVRGFLAGAFGFRRLLVALRFAFAPLAFGLAGFLAALTFALTVFLRAGFLFLAGFLPLLGLDLALRGFAAGFAFAAALPLTAVNPARSRMSADEAPTSATNSPASNTQSCFEGL
jgi:hypothetical protein